MAPTVRGQRLEVVRDARKGQTIEGKIEYHGGSRHHACTKGVSMWLAFMSDVATRQRQAEVMCKRPLLREVSNGASQRRR